MPTKTKSRSEDAAAASMPTKARKAAPGRRSVPILSALAQAHVFRDIPPEILARLAERGTQRHYPAGAEVMGQGEISDSMHVIVRGLVRVERSHPQLTEPLILAELGPCEVVGEMGVLDGESRSATVVAVIDTDTIEMGATVLAMTVLQFPQASTALLRTLSRRLRNTDELVEQMLRKERN